MDITLKVSGAKWIIVWNHNIVPLKVFYFIVEWRDHQGVVLGVLWVLRPDIGQVPRESFLSGLSTHDKQQLTHIPPKQMLHHSLRILHTSTGPYGQVNLLLFLYKQTP